MYLNYLERLGKAIYYGVVMSNEFLWVEKYRPKKVSETILPDELKQTFQNIVNGGEILNMMFTGTAGKQVEVEDTVKGFAEILDGTHDEVPESNFYMKGGIDTVEK